MGADGTTRPTIDLASLAPLLGRTCEDYRRTHRARLIAQVRAGEGGVKVAQAHARIIDGLLGALYCAADAVLRLSGRANGRYALCAVGGYGRGVLGLSSDLDVILLADDPTAGSSAAIAEAILYPLWDLGLEIGHAVRGVSETLTLAREDLRTATTLLDVRRVAGDPSIVDELLRGARRQVFDNAHAEILAKLEEECESRHERFGGSRFLLEPDVKNGCGGLRDLDAVGWAVNVRWGARTPDEAVQKGALVRREVEELEAAREALWRVRNLLHLRASRRQDRLTFEDQEEVAAELGYVDAGTSLAVEQFMQTHYRHARAVENALERTLARARHVDRRSPAPREDLGDGAMIWDGHVTLRDSSELDADPALALRVYRHVIRRALPAYPFARDAIAKCARDAGWCARLRGSNEAAQIFLELLSSLSDAPVRRGSVVSELHELGILLAMIPEFEHVTGRVQHDVYHVYTVDVHSVAAVDHLRGLLRGDLLATHPMPTRVAADAARITPLFLAVLLHDVGKGQGKDHSALGARMARPIAQRLGLSPADAANVEWLVAEHLSLYRWAMRRDTSDPASIAEVARLVGTHDRLRDLYVLTVVDLSTTSPTAMTSWKARMLDDLYLAVGAAIDGSELPSGERVAELRREACVGFAGDAGEEGLESFVREMPDRYLLANPVDVVRAHARIARDRGEQPVLLASRPGPSEDIGEIIVVTDDRPGLLADVTAVLAASPLAVVTAQIYTRVREGGHDEAFDVFHVRRAGHVDGEPVDATLLERLRRDLGALLSGRVTASELLERRPATPSWARRKSPDVRTEIVIDDDVSPRYTVVEVFTRDRSGLLHAIARTLFEQGLSIAISKINTEGERVADVFYVLDATGKKMRDPERKEALASALRAAIEALAERERGGREVSS